MQRDFQLIRKHKYPEEEMKVDIIDPLLDP